MSELTYNWALTSVANRMSPLYTFLKDVIFSGEEIPLPSSKVAMDVFSSGAEMAPLVRQGLPGKMISGRTQTLETLLNVPEIKPAKTINWAIEAENRIAGTNVSTQEGVEAINYADVKEAEVLADLLNTIERRKEWMISRLLTGTLTYQLDDLYFTIDYNLPTAHDIQAAGTDKWDDPSCDPIASVRNNYIPLIVRGAGGVPDWLIMGAGAANYLMKNSAFKDQMKWVNVAGVQAYLSAQTEIPGVEILAKGLLGMTWCVYWGQYISDTGTTAPYIADNYIYLIRTGPHMKKYYCPIATSEGTMQGMYYVQTYSVPLTSVKQYQVTSHFIPICQNMYNIVRVKVY